MTSKNNDRRRAGDAHAPHATITREREAAEVVRALRRLFKGVQQYSKAIQRHTGFSGPQIWALTVLKAEPGLSLGDLAARLFAHPSTVSGIVERLVRRRVLRRMPDPRDRRGIRIYLTEHGKRLLKKSPPPIQIGLRHALLRMSDQRLRLLRRGLGDIARETETERFEAPFFEVEP